jgi:hypothetical protein
MKKKDRLYRVRHLICNKTVNPQELNAEKAYFIDETSMKLIDLLMKSPLKWRQCNEEFDSRKTLWSHMRDSCHKRTVKCAFCETWGEPNDILKHFQQRKCYKYRRPDEKSETSTSSVAAPVLDGDSESRSNTRASRLSNGRRSLVSDSSDSDDSSNAPNVRRGPRLVTIDDLRVDPDSTGGRNETSTTEERRRRLISSGMTPEQEIRALEERLAETIRHEATW